MTVLRRAQTVTMTSERPRAGRKLRQREALFVAAYVETLNGQQAAVAAGYAPRAARVQASRLLTKDYVSAAVKAAPPRSTRAT